jgi:drug/metabolite transporter (DMT)-like permease
MSWQGLLLVLVVMTTTCVAHSLAMLALSMTPASTLQPFNYVSLPWAIALSYFVFGHVIDGLSLVGAAIIAAAGLLVMARERRLSQLRARADAETARSAAGSPPH